MNVSCFCLFLVSFISEIPIKGFMLDARLTEEGGPVGFFHSSYSSDGLVQFISLNCNEHKVRVFFHTKNQIMS